jgi:hypothetical protein
MLVDPKEGVYCSNCRSAHEDGVIAVSRTVTLIATDPHQSGQPEAIVGGVVS